MNEQGQNTFTIFRRIHLIPILQEVGLEFFQSEMFLQQQHRHCVSVDLI